MTGQPLDRTPELLQHAWALALEALRLDGAPLPRPAGRIESSALLLEVPPAAARLELAPGPAVPWRARWGLRARLRRGEEAGAGALLTTAAPRASLEAPAGEGPLRLELWLALLPGRSVPEDVPPGCEAVPLEEAAFGRATRQSSLALPASLRPPGRWMSPTRPEAAPWWDLDLGQPVHVEALRLHLADGQLPGRVLLFSNTGPEGAPHRAEAGWQADLPAGTTTHTLQPRATARFLRVALAPPPGEEAALEVTGLELLAARPAGETLEATLRRAFALFADRPLFGRRARRPDGRLGGYEVWSTYREEWARAMALAAGLGARLEAHPPALEDPTGGQPRHAVGLWAPNQAEWVVADLACVHRAWVTVPLAAADGPERVGEIAAHARLTALVVGAEQAGRLGEVVARCPTLRVVVVLPPDDRPAGASGSPAPAPALPGVEVHEFEALVAACEGQVPAPAERLPDELQGVLYTSGSTGAPRGAMRSYRAFHALLGAYAAIQPAVHLSFQPLAHFSERVMLPVVLAGGGQVGFSPGGARLYEDIALLRPTFLATVPRVFDVVRAEHEAALLAARAAAPDRDPDELERELLGRVRASFGDRLLAVSVGSAPPSRALMAFLRRCFADCRVQEGYGSTECGSITVDDGTVPPGVDVKLIDAPELGYLVADTPPRGEICVKTALMVQGYLGDPEATRARFDEDGYFHTGDLGQREPDGRVRVIGRRSHVIKLAQGEFLSPEQVEGALVDPLVEEVFVHAEGGAAAVVALVVPQRTALSARLGPGVPLDGAAAAAALHQALRAAARRAELLPFQVPAAVAVTLEPLPRTPSNKLDRRAVLARHGQLLARLQGGEEAAPGVLAALRAAAADVVGRELEAEGDLARELGVDSLAGVRLLAAVESRLDRAVPLRAWFGARSLGELARRIEAEAGVGRVAGAASAAGDARSDLALEPALDPGVLAAARGATATLGRDVLLTGATGFLGAHLLEALIARTGARVRCLVRAPDAAAARTRLRDRCARGRIEWTPAHEARVEAIPGDLARVGLGLDPATWSALAAEVDTIVHAGAVVNWLLLYGQLRAANVLGTLEVLRLAGSARPKAVHLVSTISTAPADGDETGLLADEQALATSPYALSKWVAERHARAAAARGMPLVIHRPGMITAHGTSGDCNPDDMISRYLAATVELGCALDLEDQRLDLTPVDHVAGAIVALAQGRGERDRVWHLTNVRRSPSYRGLARLLREAGAAVRPVPYPEFRAALLARPSALTALQAFFPAHGFGLGMGPWPAPATEAALAELGLEPPPSDARYVRTFLEGLRRAGRLP